MKHLWIAVVTAALLTGTAMAADAPAATPAKAPQGQQQPQKKWTPPVSRQDQIQRLEARLAKLKAMTDEQWKQQEEEYQQRFKQRMQNRRNGGRYSPRPAAPAPQQ